MVEGAVVEGADGEDDAAYAGTAIPTAAAATRVVPPMTFVLRSMSNAFRVPPSSLLRLPVQVEASEWGHYLHRQQGSPVAKLSVCGLPRCPSPGTSDSSSGKDSEMSFADVAARGAACWSCCVSEEDQCFWWSR